jgi:hypothetical protein
MTTILFEAFAPFRAEIEPRVDRSRFDVRFAPLEGGPPAADAVAPLTGGAYDVLAAWRAAGAELALFPDPAVAALCADKLVLNRRLGALGFGAVVPPLRERGAPYPYVLKRRRGAWGRQAHVVAGPEDEVAALSGEDPADWFAQALVPGVVEYAAHVLRDRGRIWYAATVTYEMAGPASVLGAHNRPLRMSYQRGCVHLRRFAAILEAIGYEGTACFDYKLAAGESGGGVPQVFEINPRFGASLAYDIDAYLDAYLAALGARRAASSGEGRTSVPAR